MPRPLADESYRRALDFLFARIDYERSAAQAYGNRDFCLDRMRLLLARLDNPQDRLAIIHVAGTKGKGSTAAMLAAVFRAAGYRSGLFSSPHLDRVEERIAVDGQPCSAAELTGLIERLRPHVGAMDAEARQQNESGPTYFELTTAMALVHFAAVGVELAVLEVGMGGRLDSTNVCLPRVAVITSISFDHTQQLGPRLADIAAEKAGIIKLGIPTVSGVVEDEPRAVIERVARERGSRLIERGRDFDFEYRPGLVEAGSAPGGAALTPALSQREREKNTTGAQHERWNQREHENVPHGDSALGAMDYLVDGQRALEAVELGLLGRHQAANAAVALAVIDELRRQGWRLPERAIRAGLREVRWPARIEVVGRRPTVIVDAAHNTASIEALVATLDESFRSRRRLLIFATTQDKDARGMLRLLLPRFDDVLLTRYTNNPRGLPLAELAALAAEAGAAHVGSCDSPRDAWSAVRERAGRDDLICATGSFFLAAEIRKEIAARPLSES